MGVAPPGSGKGMRAQVGAGRNDFGDLNGRPDALFLDPLSGTGLCEGDVELKPPQGLQSCFIDLCIRIQKHAQWIKERVKSVQKTQMRQPLNEMKM